MSRALTLLPFILLLHASGSTAESGPVDKKLLEWEKLDRIVVEIEKTYKDAKPYSDELKELSKQYESSKDVLVYSRQRLELRSKVQIAFKRLGELDHEYRSIEKTIHTKAVAMSVGRALSHQSLDGAEAEVMKGVRHTDKFKHLTDYSRELRDNLFRDEDEFQDILREQRKSRMLRAFAVGGPILLALAAAFGIWLARRRPAVMVPGQEQPVLAAPAGPVVVGEHFRLEGELGKGGMGVVYKARDTELDRVVAVKRMREEITQSKRELEMFLAEARLVAQLKHPSLVEIHSFFREGDDLYLVFEYVEGRPLHDLIDEKEKLSLEETAGILRPVAGGLDYAHSKRVIHRDLKPSNIMVAAAGGAKVMDFGIAHQAKKTVARLTHAEAWGTPPYMAPEQELGNVSKESDIFALGVVGYEMLTGQLPYEGPDFLAQKRAMEFDAPSKLVPGLPARTDEAFARALKAEPGERFHSAKELVEALAPAHSA